MIELQTGTCKSKESAIGIPGLTSCSELNFSFSLCIFLPMCSSWNIAVPSFAGRLEDLEKEKQLKHLLSSLATKPRRSNLLYFDADSSRALESVPNYSIILLPKLFFTHSPLVKARKRVGCETNYHAGDGKNNGVNYTKKSLKTRPADKITLN